jgi:hypothetical protein
MPPLRGSEQKPRIGACDRIADYGDSEESRSGAGRLLLLFAALLSTAFGTDSAIGSYGHPLAILRLSLAAISSLSGRDPVLILLGNSSIAGSRVGHSSSLTVVTNCLTSCIFVAIWFCKQTGGENHARNRYGKFHSDLHYSTDAHPLTRDLLIYSPARSLLIPRISAGE